MRLETRIPPPVWALTTGLAMWALHRGAPLAVLVPRPWNRLGALAVAGVIAIVATAMLQFRRASTTVNPLAPEQASALVTSGIYAHTRNPMYLGLCTALAGVATLFGSASPWLVLPAFVLAITRLQIAPEERVLARLFGAPYLEYCARVGRWLGRGRPLH